MEKQEPLKLQIHGFDSHLAHQRIIMHKTYDIDIEMTGRIGANATNHIVVAAIERQTGRQVSDIRVRYKDEKFDGFDITFDPNLKKHHNFKPTKEFIATNFDEN